MKLIAAVALSVAALGANAETITVGPAGGFGALEQFYNVQNDSGITPLNIIGCDGLGSCQLILADVTCFAPRGTTLSCVNQVDSSDAGWAITAFDITKRRVCNRSGRGGGYCHYLFFLQGGTIERP